MHAGHSLDPTKLLTSLRKEFISGRNLPLFLTKERHEETKPPCNAVCFPTRKKEIATHFPSDDLIPEVVIQYPWKKKKKKKKPERTQNVLRDRSVSGLSMKNNPARDPLLRVYEPH